jgi:hypothetical protein
MDLSETPILNRGESLVVFAHLPENLEEDSVRSWYSVGSSGAPLDIFLPNTVLAYGAGTICLLLGSAHMEFMESHTVRFPDHRVAGLLGHHDQWALIMYDKDGCYTGIGTVREVHFSTAPLGMSVGYRRSTRSSG